MLWSLIRRPRFRSFDQKLDLRNRRNSVCCEDYLLQEPTIQLLWDRAPWHVLPFAIYSCQWLCIRASPWQPVTVSLTGMIFTGVSHKYLMVKPKMSHSHPVLGQSTGLIWANDRGGPQSLYCLQILHKTIFLGHSFGCQRESHLNRRERNFEINDHLESILDSIPWKEFKLPIKFQENWTWIRMEVYQVSQTDLLAGKLLKSTHVALLY